MINHVFTHGNAFNGCTQCHRLEDGSFRVTFYLMGHEPPSKGYALTLEEAQAASNRFVSPPLVLNNAGIEVAQAIGTESLSAGLGMLSSEPLSA
jgi:hypothetical protein